MRKVNLSETALKNIQEIKLYLISKWSERIYLQFKTKLETNLHLISRNPELYPKSGKNIYKCLLIKQITIFYRFNASEIQILSLFDTRQKPTKINKIK
jgi:plasmid stabilization system protein ParE